MRWARGLVCGLLVLAPAEPAAAADPAATTTPLQAYPAGPVNAVAVAGATAYVGGAFRHVGPVTGPLASVDAVDGTPAAGRPLLDGSVTAATPDGAGGFYVAGTFTRVGDVERDGLARIRPDGRADPDWAPTVDGFVNDIVRFGDSVFVGGDFETVNGGTARRDLAGFDADTGAVTTLDVPIGAPRPASQFVRSLGLYLPDFTEDPLLFVGGNFAGAGSNGAATHVVAIDVGTGTLDSSFDPALDGPVADLAVIERGSPISTVRVWVGGSFGKVNGTSKLRLAALELDGDLDPWTASTFFPHPVTTLAPGAGNLYVGGHEAGFGAAVRAYELDDGGEVFASPTFGFNFHEQINDLLPVGGALYVAGLFASVDGEPRSNLAALDTVTGDVLAWDPEARGDGVSALAVDGERILVGGDQATTGGVERRGVAAFDLSSGALLPFDPDVAGAVQALLVDGSRLYAGGDFQAVNGSVPRRGVAAFDRGSGAVTSFDAGLVGSVRALAMSQGRIVAGGDFTMVNGGVLRDGLANFDPITGAAGDLAPEIDSSVRALLGRDDGVLLGGNISKVNGVTRGGAAGLTDIAGTIGALTPFDPRADGSVFAVAQDGDTVYIGGQFTTVGGTARSRFAAVDARTGAVREPAMDTATLVGALARVGDRLIVGGFGGDSALYAVDPTTGARTGWAPIDPFVGGVAAVAASPEGGLLAGGSFDRLSQSAPPLPRLAWFAILPSAPSAPVATAGDRSATVDVPAAPSGGSPITEYRVVADPGGRAVVTGTPGPLAVDGLDNGTTYTFTVTATNAVGTGPASPPSNPVTPSAPGTPPPGADTTAPVISGLRAKPKRFAVARRRTPLVARVRRGTRFRFTLSEDASTAIAIQRARPGRRRGAKCVAPRRGRGRRCTRWKRVATLRRASTKQGLNSVKFSGRAGRKKLRPGRHRARLVATDAVGNRSLPATVRFRIVRSR